MEVKTSEPNWSKADIVLFEEVYQLLCTSRMNAIYYTDRLRELQKVSFIMEIIIAATASGSGVGALMPTTDIGSTIWKGLLLVAAVVSVVRPIYAPGKKIELVTRQQHGYMANYFALKKLAHRIRQQGGMSDETRKQFDTIYDRHVQLTGDDEPAPDGKKVEKARKETGEELPRIRFWWPFEHLMPNPEPDRDLAAAHTSETI